jgi:hypothetical protein
MRIAGPGVGISITAAGVLLGVTAWAAAAEATSTLEISAESAVWTSRELNFVYQGFTAQYSCEGLRDRMAEVLRQLGARGDLDVRESGCVSLGQPDAFPGVRIRMNVLQPATAGTSAAAVPAHWKRVDLTGSRGPLETGECELLEQIRTQILPLFATRRLEYGSNCQPHQLQLGGTWLRAEVLVPDPNPAAADRPNTGAQ